MERFLINVSYSIQMGNNNYQWQTDGAIEGWFGIVEYFDCNRYADMVLLSTIHVLWLLLIVINPIFNNRFEYFTEHYLDRRNCTSSVYNKAAP